LYGTDTNALGQTCGYTVTSVATGSGVLVVAGGFIGGGLGKKYINEDIG
jgi:hypothetical protein